MRTWIICVVIAALLSPASAWTQIAGDTNRGGIVAFDSQLDVVGLLAAQDYPVNLGNGPGYVDVDGALWSVLSDGEGCVVAKRTYSDEQLVRGRFPCTGFDPLLQGYDPIYDQLIACHGSTFTVGPIVMAVGRDGGVAWQVGPSDLPGISQFSSNAAWSCGGAVINLADELVVVAANAPPPNENTDMFSGGFDHRLLAIDLRSGEIVWNADLRADDALRSLVDPGTPLGPLEETAAPNVILHGISQDGGDYFVTGTAEEVPIIWAVNSENGRSHMMEVIGQNQAPDPQAALSLVQFSSLGPSLWPAAQAGDAIALLGQEIIQVKTAGQAPNRIKLENAAAPADGVGSLWWADVGIIPTETGLLVMDMNEPVRLRHSINFQGGIVKDLAFGVPDKLYALIGTSNGDRLVEINPISGQQTHWLPLPMVAAKFVPAGDELWIIDELGSGIRLGQSAEAKPGIGLSTKYPPANGRIEVAVTAPEGANKTWIHWGTGASRQVTDGNQSYVYSALGDQTLRVTSMLAGGNTSTTLAVVHVGETEPPQKTLLQIWFASDNLDMTWGVIGILVAVIGGLFTYIVRGRRRMRLGKDLSRLQVLRDMARDEPLEALAGLRGFRKNARVRARTGRIDEAHYASLVAEISLLTEGLQNRLLRGFKQQLGPKTVSIIETALADGVLSADELEEIQEGLAGEQLTDNQRRSLLEMLGDWH